MSKDKTKAKESKAALFFKGVKAEFRKIIWPDRDTMLSECRSYRRCRGCFAGLDL